MLIQEKGCKVDKKGWSFHDEKGAPFFQFLTTEQISRSHEAKLEVLKTTGVTITYPEALVMLYVAGCEIISQNLVYIPGNVVEDATKLH